MKKIKAFLGKLRWKNLKIRGQMNYLYLFALIIPLTIVGIALMYSADKKLNEYYVELIESDNSRVKTLYSQITTAAYGVSNDICYDSTQSRVLSDNYEKTTDFISAANENNGLDNIIYNDQQISSIQIYCDNPTITDYKQYRSITPEIKEEEWYQLAMKRSAPFWIGLESLNAYGNKETHLSLVRHIFLPNSEYNAFLIIRLDNSYVHSRIDSNSIDAIALEQQGIVYSSKSNWIGREVFIDIDYDDIYYSYSGTVEVDGENYYMATSTSNLFMTDSKLYIITLNESVYDDIKNITNTLLVILIVAVLVPGVILIGFSYKFTGRIYLLREEMHKASMKEYDMMEKFPGHDELTEAFDDLKKMVSDIKEKEAIMYEAELKEKELINNQQKMEYKMLASQINPHYLYNTLETIRMKSLTMGNKEVADSIKILGKTLQYVLKNTGTTSTTLKKEIEHVENYLAIQKLRFGNRINYTLEIEDGLEPEKYVVLPLLLQPIVENAVVHGLENINGEGHITIKILHNDFEELQISISDNGQGMLKEEYEKVREKLSTPGLKLESSIGVYNICERIRLHYGEEYGLHIESEYGKGTRVILYLPVIKSI